MTNKWRTWGTIPHPSICPDKIENLISANSTQALSTAKHADVYLIECGQRFYVLKIFHMFSFWHAVKSIFHPSRAVRNFHNTQLLQHYHIHTPTVYLAAERRCFGWLKHAFMISEYVNGQDAEAYFRHANLKSTEAKAYAKGIIAILQRLSRLGIRHGDLGIWNFTLKERQVYVLDLDAMRRGKSKDLQLFIERLCYYPTAWTDFFKSFL